MSLLSKAYKCARAYGERQVVEKGEGGITTLELDVLLASTVLGRGRYGLSPEASVQSGIKRRTTT